MLLSPHVRAQPLHRGGDRLVVDAVKADLKMPKLDVKYQLVTSANRIPLIANGTVDLECGSTTNNVERQKQVSFTITHFLTANRYVSKKASGIKSIDDLKGKTIVSTSGTTNIKQATDLNVAKGMGMNIIPANGHPEAFQMVETGRAVAFVMDDILLYTLVAQSRTPDDYVISSDALSLPEPYGIMMRKDDPAFKKVVDAAMTNVFKSGEINKIYAKAGKALAVLAGGCTDNSVTGDEVRDAIRPGARFDG